MKVLTFAVAAISALALTGCAATPSQPALTGIHTEAEQFMLTGDEIQLEAHFSHPTTSATKIVHAIEQSTDGGETWESVAEETYSTSAPDFVVSYTVPTDEESDSVFRSEILADGKSIASSGEFPIVVRDLSSMIRTLYYDMAHVNSVKKHISYIKKHDYPGLYPFKSKKWKKAEKEYKSAVKYLGWEDSYATYVSELSSIDSDKKWIPKSKCSAKLTEPPAGRTFIHTIQGGIDNTKSDVHVTYLGGELYFYMDLCG